MCRRRNNATIDLGRRITKLSMSDFVLREEQQNPAEISRWEWFSFSQDLSQMTQNSSFYQQLGSLCESVSMKTLRSAVRNLVTGGEERIVRWCLRSEGVSGRMRCSRADKSFVGYEGAPIDGYIILIDPQCEDVPPETASDYAMWSWARAQPRGVEFIACDVKSQNISNAERLKDAVYFHFYRWTKNNKPHNKEQGAEIIVAFVQGIDDYIGIVPGEAFVEDTCISSYGIETLTGKVPHWMALFMVHVDEVSEAVRRLAVAAAAPRDDKAADYINPTTEVRLTGLRPKTSDSPRLEPESTSARAMGSFTGTNRLWREIEAVGGWKVEFNPIAPNIHDFYLFSEKTGYLRIELKELHAGFDGLQSMRAFDPRSWPFAVRRLWHFLYVIVSDGVVCFSRFDTEPLRGEAPSEAAVAKHTFQSFADAIPYIEKHAEVAKQAANRALRAARPEDIVADLRQWQVEHQPLEVISQPQSDSRQSGAMGLPWVGQMINYHCMEAGFGVCLPLGVGHPFGTHVFVEYDWDENDKEDFKKHGGMLPLDLWTRGASQLLCLVLRFQDHSMMSSCTPKLGMPLTVRLGHWRKPVSGKHCLVVGSIWPARLHETHALRTSQYLLLPSQYTVLTDGKDHLPEPDRASKSSGGHFFAKSPRHDRELTEPKFPNLRGNAPIDVNMGNQKGFIKDKLQVLDYVFNLADGTINRKLESILKATGALRLQDSRNDGVPPIEPEKYRIQLREVLQMGWDYGCECCWIVLSPEY